MVNYTKQGFYTPVDETEEDNYDNCTNCTEKE